MRYLEAKSRRPEVENKSAAGPPENKQPEGPNATDAAVALAGELGVDITAVTGTGAEGRVTVGNVRAAAEQE